jgi:hypothetical protein
VLFEILLGFNEFYKKVNLHKSFDASFMANTIFFIILVELEFFAEFVYGVIG